MSANLESFLARLYTDAAARSAFLADPVSMARAAGLSEADAADMSDVDRPGLRMAAASYANKRERHGKAKPKFPDTFSQWWARP